MSDVRLDRLEERLAWLERHVEEQDKVMLEQAETIDRLRAELRLLRDRTSAPSGDNASPVSPADERPPHY
jgi:SlyX protein